MANHQAVITPVDGAGAALTQNVAQLRVEETLQAVRVAPDRATAEMEYEALLTRLDALNEAAGSVLAAIRDS